MMPNHITNLVTFTGPVSEIESILKTHIAEDHKHKYFDFKTVIPMPECVKNTEAGSEADLGFYALTSLFSSKFGFERNPLGNASARFNRDFFSSYELRAWMTENQPDILAKGEQLVTCFRETGHLNWYDWSCANWGTKWNSYEYEEVSRSHEANGLCVTVRFQTANGVPDPIFERLSEMYPGGNDLCAIGRRGRPRVCRPL